ncbi:MAG: polyphosphate kinase 2 [Anaerolineae bacterium]|nr:polyphosphate kinase 2 [Anaerolineae bacterium]
MAKGENAKKRVASELQSEDGRLQEEGKEKRRKKKKAGEPRSRRQWLDKKFYEKELARLQLELVKMQYWIREEGKRVVLVFEGRDAAGKGGIIKRITEPLNPRGVRLVALGVPSDVEKTQWYFQRYAAHLPAAGEVVIFDRSWYNRANVERVMGFCTDPQYWEFLRSCPEFERMLTRSGIILIKYWLSVSDEEQERRFQERSKDPTRRWKLSPMDLKSREKWVEYSKAKDIMFEHTDIPEARWYQIESDDKRRARLNCIRHLLGQIPYEDVTPPPLELPPRPPDDVHYARPPRDAHLIVEDYYAGR